MPIELWKGGPLQLCDTSSLRGRNASSLLTAAGGKGQSPGLGNSLTLTGLESSEPHNSYSKEKKTKNTKQKKKNEKQHPPEVSPFCRCRPPHQHRQEERPCLGRPLEGRLLLSWLGTLTIDRIFQGEKAMGSQGLSSSSTCSALSPLWKAHASSRAHWDEGCCLGSSLPRPLLRPTVWGLRKPWQL